MKGKLIKLLTPVIIIGILLFLITNNFICTPPGLAPEFKEIKQTEIIKFNSDSLWVSIVIIAENKNDFDVDIKDLLVNIIHQNDTIGSAGKDEKILLESFETGEVEFNATLGTEKMLALISSDEDSLKLDLVGSAIANLGLISLPVDVDLSFVIAVKEQIAKSIKQDTDDDKIITIVSAGIKSMNLGESNVEIDFKINNPYGIEFSVIDYPSTIFINGSEAGTGNVDNIIIVHSKGNESKGTIKYQLSNSKTFASLFGSLFSGKLEYETEGILLIDILGFNIQFPYSMKGVLVKI
jgi:LEA14-like dessication related protein